MIYYFKFNFELSETSTDKETRKNALKKCDEVWQNAAVAEMHRCAYQTSGKPNLNLRTSVAVDVDVLICLFCLLLSLLLV